MWLSVLKGSKSNSPSTLINIPVIDDGWCYYPENRLSKLIECGSLGIGKVKIDVEDNVEEVDNWNTEYLL